MRKKMSKLKGNDFPPSSYFEKKKFMFFLLIISLSLLKDFSLKSKCAYQLGNI